MTLNEVRTAYLEFFKARGHTVIPSSSLVPENDPTTLFTGSGMQQLMPYLLGKNHAAGSRLTDSQKCFRSGDIEEVGDNRHTTFFEMLGNWSLGDYFKHEQLPWFFEFLTDEKDGIGLSAHKLFVTVFTGDEANNVPRDTESVEIWKANFKKKNIDAKVVEIGSEEDGYQKGMSFGLADGEVGRIFYYNAKKNWWSRSGTPDKMPVGEPGGPDSEVFYDFGSSTASKGGHASPEADTQWGPQCHPNCDCGRFLEIGNSVFMQYLKKPDGSFGLLPKQNVDFGGGLERLMMAASNEPDIIKVCHAPILNAIALSSGKVYGRNAQETKSFRIIADHIKAAVFLIADGVIPGKSDQGYFVRRLIRRSVQHLDKLGIGEKAFNLAVVVSAVAEMYKDQYPELQAKLFEIEQIVGAEEAQFRLTLQRGIKELARFASDGSISANDAFQLVTTYGFPLELIIEEAGERGIKQIDIEGFKELLKAHQELSRAGSESKFKGGLADASEATTRLHTAHHLLLKALQMVLGPSVKQRGSNITGERLRIDFSWGEKITDAQKKEVERIVNEKIAEDLPVTRNELDKEVAEKLGAEHEFGAKYPDRVTVYAVGPKSATAEHPHLGEAFSMEFCGGPHVEHTGELARSGTFKILKEEAVAAGIRRIKAVLE